MCDRAVCAVCCFCGLQKYVQTPNLAEYLGLHTVDSLHMSVPLNAVFIGFKGEGNAKVCRTAHMFKSTPWRNVAHTLQGFSSS